MKINYLKNFAFQENLSTQPQVMALGFFDGVHRGHQQVIGTARKIAQQRSLALGVMTFNRHASMMFTKQKNTDFRYLNTLDQKVHLMAQQGVDQLYIVNFTRAFGNVEPQTFVQKYLLGLQVQVAVAGFDFTFGKYGLAGMQTMQKLGQNKFQTVTVPKLDEQQQKISSTRIRHLLSSGQIAEARELLGHDYLTVGQVIGKGQVILPNKMQQLPPAGQYECQVTLGKEQHFTTAWVKERSSLPISEIINVDLSAFQANTPLTPKIQINWLNAIKAKTKNL
ncbi:FAD synthetase family protein [Ligilactobacillus acidipiscis]|uniref:FAD synthetase family protein n=1 Tax=Ligilactobacillus acidipiscis TaxID=89059 RepID=UPI0023F6C306|nr:FAD synthetase family protein [Ligilactobacillus acidipiscis]WEV58192.1 FAD synthetase family protein [Ligilactobacillus acidipiscis]